MKNENQNAPAAPAKTLKAKAAKIEKIARANGHDVTVTVEKRTAKKPAAPKKAKVETAPVQAVENAPAREEKIEMPAALTIDAEKLQAKIAGLEKKAAGKAAHVAYGYFVLKTAKNNVVTLQFHPQLKKTNWTIRDLEGKPVTDERFATLWQAAETANKNY